MRFQICIQVACQFRLHRWRFLRHAFLEPQLESALFNLVIRHFLWLLARLYQVLDVIVAISQSLFNRLLNGVVFYGTINWLLDFWALVLLIALGLSSLILSTTGILVEILGLSCLLYCFYHSRSYLFGKLCFGECGFGLVKSLLLLALLLLVLLLCFRRLDFVCYYLWLCYVLRRPISSEFLL